jgi:hypothetical protein
MLSILVSLVSLVSLLAVLIFLHELFRFLAAKLARVEIFSLGFPFKLVCKKVGLTESQLGSLPLGGCLKHFGEEPGLEGTPERLSEKLPEKPLEKRPGSFCHKIARAMGFKVLAPTAGLLFIIVFAAAALTALTALGLPAMAKAPPHRSPAIDPAAQYGPAAIAALKVDGLTIKAKGWPASHFVDPRETEREDESLLGPAAIGRKIREQIIMAENQLDGPENKVGSRLEWERLIKEDQSLRREDSSEDSISDRTAKGEAGQQSEAKENGGGSDLSDKGQKPKKSEDMQPEKKNNAQDILDKLEKRQKEYEVRYKATGA